MNWNAQKYTIVLNRIKETGSLNGTPIKSKEEIYKLIAPEVFSAEGTVKGWSRTNSPGPGDLYKLRALEKALGLPINCLCSEEETEDIPKMEMNNLTDVNKHAIFKMYELMKDYLHDDFENEECFCKMCDEVQKYSILVPDELYTKVYDFIDHYLAPIIYKTEETYAACYTDEIGHYNDDGIWKIKSEEACKQMCINFMLKNIEIEEELDKFAKRELHPYLV